MLSRLGYEADVADKGVAALDALQRKQYDVVLMDVQMPRWTVSKRPDACAQSSIESTASRSSH